MGGTGKTGIPVLSEQPQCDRLRGRAAVCGEVGVLCKPIGRRGVCQSAPRESLQRAEGGDGTESAGRKITAFMRHFFHGTGY